MCIPTSSAALLGCDALCRHRWVLLEPVKRATGFNTQPHNHRGDALFTSLPCGYKIEGNIFSAAADPLKGMKFTAKTVFEFTLGQLALVKTKKKKTSLHAIRLLRIPLSSPLACSVPMTCQPLLVDLLSLLLPAEVLRPLPAGHGHGHVYRAFRAWPSTLQEQE